MLSRLVHTQRLGGGTRDSDVGGRIKLIENLQCELPDLLDRQNGSEGLVGCRRSSWPLYLGVRKATSSNPCSRRVKQGATVSAPQAVYFVPSTLEKNPHTRSAASKSWLRNPHRSIAHDA